MAYKTYRIVHWDTQFDSEGNFLLDESILLLVNGGVTWTVEDESLTGAVVEDALIDALLSKVENLHPVVDAE